MSQCNKIRCCHCNIILDEEELITIEDYRGEFWGVPAYETISVCPYCRMDDLEDVEEEEEE